MVATTSEVPAAQEVQAKKAAKAKAQTTTTRTAAATTTTKTKSKRAAARKVDSVDRTATRDETKVRPSRASTKAVTGGVSLDPNLPLIPGNAVSFVAEERPGRVQAKIVTAKDSWLVAASNIGGDARVSKILEVPGEITVEFYEDGKLYASGTWTVG